MQMSGARRRNRGISLQCERPSSAGYMWERLDAEVLGGSPVRDSNSKTLNLHV